MIKLVRFFLINAIILGVLFIHGSTSYAAIQDTKKEGLKVYDNVSINNLYMDSGSYVHALNTIGSDASANEIPTEITKVDINIVKSIINKKELKNAKKTTNIGVNGIFSFTIEKPAYVFAETDTTCFNGIAQITLDLEGKKPVVNSGYENYGSDEYYTFGSNTTYLEAGTYYVHFFNEDESMSVTYLDGVTYAAPFTHSVKVSAQYVERSVKLSTSLSHATYISCNKKYSGFLSSTVRKQCYKFVLKKRANISVDANAEYRSGAHLEDGLLSTYTSGSCCAFVNLYNSQMEKIDSMEIYSDNYVSATPINSVLNPGTYYVEIADENDPTMYGYTSLELVKWEPEYLARPKVTSKKDGTKVIEGTAVPNSELTIFYKRDRYTTIASSKGKFKIELDKSLEKGEVLTIYATKYVTNRFYKSTTVRFKVG